jgi:hypothetical protein
VDPEGAAPRGVVLIEEDLGVAKRTKALPFMNLQLY